jgi:hypothetical protein
MQWGSDCFSVCSLCNQGGIGPHEILEQLLHFRQYFVQVHEIKSQNKKGQGCDPLFEDSMSVCSRDYRHCLERAKNIIRCTLHTEQEEERRQKEGHGHQIPVQVPCPTCCHALRHHIDKELMVWHQCN